MIRGIAGLIPGKITLEKAEEIFKYLADKKVRTKRIPLEKTPFCLLQNRGRRFRVY